ncbi:MULTISPECIES: hypothetical protein [unclassified Crossiella]|uniref:hypothetical protein n=1 Tax=unclassified Crossiella TaxID=2620835 RepID=UPI001FFFA773|nr:MULTISPECIES: hypothetical protein [unclassified Crossiella]MCK2241521.1 hypothetical protein [Crossiella sp. S99.2]MCK2255607.1 hypothetical protein [Crossiella sp. S99.1]
MTALLLCGPRAVGKSVVGWQVYAHLARTGVAVAYLDLAQLGFCQPDSTWLTARNLASAWTTFRANGIRSLVLSGDISGPAVLDSYAEALPGIRLTVCELRAGRERLTERILARGQGHGPPIPGDDLRGRDPDELRRLAAESPIRRPIGDLRVDTDNRSVAEVADRVRLAWLSP